MLFVSRPHFRVGRETHKQKKITAEMFDKDGYVQFSLNVFIAIMV